MVDREWDDWGAEPPLSRELLAQIIVDICMLDPDLISDAELQSEVRRMGRGDWIVASSKLRNLIFRDDVWDSRAVFDLRTMELIKSVHLLDRLFHVSAPLYSNPNLRRVKPKLFEEQRSVAMALVHKYRPSKPIT